MSIDSPTDLAALRAAGRVVAETLRMVAAHTRAGVTTRELDDVARAVFDAHGARSGPALDYGFPGTICISVNEEAVHGIPGARVLRGGDLVTIDVTAELDGYYADAAVTLAIEPADARAQALVRAAESAFRKGIAQLRAGVPLWRVGDAIEREVKRRGFRVLRDLAGHGIGRCIHEEPEVLNYRNPSSRQELTENLVLTVEPIIAQSAIHSVRLEDGWTVVSADRSLTAHHEHTLVVQRGEPLILTA
ncbi:MAG: type I methionyl aminopeptidase [Longimicrobiales bacterium]